MKQESEAGNALRVIFEDSVGLEDLDDFLPEFINWQPRFDLYVVRDEVVVTVEVTGIEPRDIMVYAGKTYLLVKGIRRSPEYLNKDCCVFHNLEIPYGQFFRRIELPLTVAPTRLKASVQNGLLTVTVPAAKERIIPID